MGKPSSYRLLSVADWLSDVSNYIDCIEMAASTLTNPERDALVEVISHAGRRVRKARRLLERVRAEGDAS